MGPTPPSDCLRNMDNVITTLPCPLKTIEHSEKGHKRKIESFLKL